MHNQMATFAQAAVSGDKIGRIDLLRHGESQYSHTLRGMMS